MNAGIPIVEGGGWRTRQVSDRPRTRFFGFLTVVWLGVSLCASYPFWNGWPPAFSFLEWFSGVLLLLQLIFGILFLVCYRTESPRRYRKIERHPDRDLRRLH